ncbi:sensor histidine kinase [Clostridium sp. Marseille-P3244]|uniref:sensor histidine kinase n=1 Tax=Clostridium sp. Marseille-P3244 TaxID=1871020 RepID=UPI000931AFEE|nr:sensor histidine kinase [Clostridium sp. Marseille-P3244]
MSEKMNVKEKNDNTTQRIRLLWLCAAAEALVTAALFMKDPDVITAILLVACYGILFVIIRISVKSMQQIRQILLQKAESEKKAVEAELEQKRQHLLALESQINPHFLYNTLDTFRGIALEGGNRQLSDMIEALSRMFKYSVNYEAEMVTINAELDYLSRYIQLQQLRFPGRFVYQEDINCTPEQLLLEPCPRFVLQPIVENAVRHGLKDVRSGGCITVAMEIRHDDFYIFVEDNGCGMSQQETARLNQKLAEGAGEESGRKEKMRERGGIGLFNVNKRIKMFCGEEYGLKVSSVPDVGTQVSICLPLYEEARTRV